MNLEPSALPRAEAGVLIQAASAPHATTTYVLLREIVRVRTAERSVLVLTRSGESVIVWTGDDQEAKALALKATVEAVSQ